MRTMVIDGQTKFVREETFQATKEEWDEYTLGNGDRVRIKVVVHKILRVLDANGNPVFTNDGDPEMVVRHQVQVTVSSEIGPEQQREMH